MERKISIYQKKYPESTELEILTCGFGFVMITSSCALGGSSSVWNPVDCSIAMGFFVGLGFVQYVDILSTCVGFGFVMKLGCVVMCHCTV